jgi:hypothetical protein
MDTVRKLDDWIDNEVWDEMVTNIAQFVRLEVMREVEGRILADQQFEWPIETRVDDIVIALRGDE